MVRAANHQYTFVLAHSINGIEEERADLRRYEGVEVFEDEIAGCTSARQFKDQIDAILGPGERGKRLDIERWNGWTQRVQGVHRSFDADRLSVAWWSVEDNSTLPRNAQAMIGLSCLVAEEVSGNVPEIVFQRGWEDDVLPAGLLDRAVEGGVFLPVALVEDPDLAVQSGGPVADILNHSIDLRLSGGEDVLVSDYWVGFCAVTAIDKVYKKLEGLVSIDEGVVEGFLGYLAGASRPGNTRVRWYIDGPFQR